MPIYVVKTGSETLRVRQEEFGCTVWSRDKYAEGDETTLEILKRMSEGNSIEKIAQDLAKEHNTDIQQIYADLLPMFQEFSKVGWFLTELKTVEEHL